MVHRTGPAGRREVVPPAPATVDLHTHTSRSDGVMEPSDFVAAAAAAGIRQLAIADHDTLSGYRDGRLAAERLEVVLIPGVEINSVADGVDGFNESELHVLGYGVDSANDEFEAILSEQRGRRRERFVKTVELLRQIGLSIDPAVAGLSLDNDSSLGRPTVARCLVAEGHAETVDDAFRRILSRGKPGYVPRLGIGPRGAIDAIRNAGGLPVLAHFSDGVDRPGVVRELQELGLGGLEVYYRGFWAETVDGLASLARALRLTPTGGSDYHGDRETYAHAYARLWVPPAVGTGLLATLQSLSHG